MKILCASSVTRGPEAFSTLGDVTSASERDVDAAAVRAADALIIRSKVRVQQALLQGSRVAFVGTATAGTDHMDLAYLSQNEIAWTAAPGCNANSVAEYVVAALFVLARRTGSVLAGKTLGIVGVGHVGSRVAELAGRLGLRVLLNDPPLFAQTGDAKYMTLDDMLPRCDVVTLHVPLIETDPYATRKLVNARFLDRLPRGAWFINAARGEVVDSDALLAARRNGTVGRMVLDVFEREPACVPELVRAADLATPHIAGYSYEGKLNGTRMVYKAACNFFEVVPTWTGAPASPPSRVPLPVAGRGAETLIGEAVRSAYDLEADDRALRSVDCADAVAFGRHFERLRATYPERHEFPGRTIVLDRPSPAVETTLRALGFGTVEPS